MKFRYIILFALILIVIKLSVANYSDELSQVIVSEDKRVPVDADSNGFIDKAEYAETVENFVNFPARCPSGSIIKGFDIQGTPICVEPEMICEIVDNERQCYFIDDKDLLTRSDYSLLVSAEQNEGSTLSISYSHDASESFVDEPNICKGDSDKKLKTEYCECVHYDQDNTNIDCPTINEQYYCTHILYKKEPDKVCLNKVSFDGVNFEVEVYVKNEGNEYITKVNVDSLYFGMEEHKEADVEKDADKTITI